MIGKASKTSLLIASVYWIPSSFVLLTFMNGSDMIFPEWIDNILFPGYILGFALGFGGGTFWAFIGQIITLLILFIIIRIIYAIFQLR